MKRISRRRFLAGSSASIALLAGCAGQGGESGESGGSGGNSTSTSTQTATQTSIRTATQEASTHDEHGDNSSEHGGNHSEESGHHSSEMPQSPSEEATVGMGGEDGENHFEPHIAWVKPGGTVTWTLESGAHSTTAYHPNNDKPLRIPEGPSAWDSGTLAEEGATFEHTFDTKGVYDYFCTPHESQGMIGTVIVGRPEPSGQPGLEPPQASLPQQAQERIKELNEMEMKLLG